MPSITWPTPKTVTVKLFNARFRQVGRMINDLERVSAKDARRVKRLYSAVTTGFRAAQSDPDVRARLYQTLASIRRTTSRRLTEHSRPNIPDDVVDPFR